jgi:hypothetical protein
MKQATVITHLMLRALTGNLGGETHGLWGEPFAATATYRAKERALQKEQGHGYRALHGFPSIQ